MTYLLQPSCLLQVKQCICTALYTCTHACSVETSLNAPVLHSHITLSDPVLLKLNPMYAPFAYTTSASSQLSTINGSPYGSHLPQY